MTSVNESERTSEAVAPIGEERAFQALLSIGAGLNLPIERASLDLSDVPVSDVNVDEMALLMAGARQVGITLKEIELAKSSELFDLILDGYPVMLAAADGTLWVFETTSAKQIEVSRIGKKVERTLLSRRHLRLLVKRESEGRLFVAKKELECDSLSAASGHIGHGQHGGHDSDHVSPLRRFLSLLNMDRRDVWTIALFALVAGILGLATPLAVESLVNVVSWGTYLQPLIVLGLMLFACLGLAGFMRILQTVVVEMIQRRQLVRIVGDLAHRFPRANRQSLVGEYPRELANRVFDIMTIQKATAVLLLDGVSIVLTTVLGMLLLAFYHPFLLGFDIVLLIAMISITWLLGRGGIRTAIDESIMKYNIAHWLQDVIASPAVFKINGGEMLAVDRANRLVSEYIQARQKQFRVVIRQVTFAIGLQVFASTAVLALGGWLVIDGQLTLGQLVASELVVTVVVGAFAKAGKSLEKFYDLMAGVDKVGHLLDIPVDPRHELGELPSGPVEVSWTDLSFPGLASSSKIAATTIDAGSRVAIFGDDVEGRTRLARALAGLTSPAQGSAQVAGFDAEQAAQTSSGRLVAYAGGHDVFHATLQENVDLGRSAIGQSRIREVLEQVGLAPTVLRLPDGLQTMLQTDGYPLSRPQIVLLMLARAIAARPSLLIVDGLLDELGSEIRDQVWQSLSTAEAPWTLVVVTNREDVAMLCDTQVAVRNV